MLNVCCFKWRPAKGYRSKFGPETVNALKRMVQRHYQQPHTFTCITDDANGIDADVRILPLWADYGNVPSPHGGHNPSCYRRLKLFSAEAAELVGQRFVVVDLDTVIVADVSPLWDRSEDFVIWGETHPTSFYNGSMWLLTAGSRTKVWELFDPKTTPQQAKKAGRFGSDQGVIGFILGQGEATWTRKDGVYSYRVHLQPSGGQLPENARVVCFHGKIDPWHQSVRHLPWIQEHYYGSTSVNARCA